MYFICLLLTFAPSPEQIPPDFLGEPETIEQLPLDSGYWVPAHCLYVDSKAKCWLDPKQRLDEKNDHLIFVKRVKKKVAIRRGIEEENLIGFVVTFDKSKLQGWRWKLSNLTGNYYEHRGYFPVMSITVED